MSGRKFLLFILLPAILVFGLLIKIFGPDRPLGGPSAFLPPSFEAAPSPTPTPTPTTKVGTAAPASPAAAPAR